MEKKAIDLLKQFIDSGRDTYPEHGLFNDNEFSFEFDDTSIIVSLREYLELSISITVKNKGRYITKCKLSYKDYDFVQSWMNDMREREKINCIKAFNKIVTPGNFDPSIIEL